MTFAEELEQVKVFQKDSEKVKAIVKNPIGNKSKNTKGKSGVFMRLKQGEEEKKETDGKVKDRVPSNEDENTQSGSSGEDYQYNVERKRNVGRI